ncbi:gamma carbonic anhydrase family protein [Pseudomonas sp. GCM10022186]|uniref:gamma carbonic anhydrase family protein n=1 Tax=Pseudomonas sp. GCM10022186 TaxID=3252650 RepID=UPI00361A5265
MAIYQFDGSAPDVHESTYVAEDATVIGKVVLREGASVWPQAVLRGDNEVIDIGAGSNVQEGAVLHTDPGFPLKVGDNVTIGHQAMLHGCSIGEGSLIGIQAVILNGAVIGRNCLVGAGAVVTEGKVFPDNSLIIGAPAKVLRELDEAAVAKFHENARDYVERAQLHKTRLVRIS